MNCLYNNISGEKPINQVTKITFTIGVINIFLSYILIVKFGLIGAAYSLLIISFFQYILSFYVGHKLIPMPWFKRIAWG